MSSSSKGGGAASQSYNYYGTVVGAVAQGPVDRLLAVLVDGKAIYEPIGGLAASGDFTDLTSAVAAEYFAPGGYLRIYWGTQSQSADPALPGHPAYRGICYLVAKSFLFGRERSTAPNIELVVQRRPRPPVELVAEAHAALVHGQASPVAVVAELLTLAGWSSDGCDAASWLGVSAAVHASAEARALSFGSPLLTRSTELRQVLRELLQAADLWLRDRNGVLELGIAGRGGDPSSLPLLTAVDFTEVPQVTTQSWAEVPGRVVVQYHDGLRWKDSAETWDNPVARLIAETGKDLSVSASWITRRDQAQRFAAALVRRFGVPGLRAVLRCRRAKVVNLWPGERVKLALEPEPSDDVGLAVSGLIVDREEGDGDEVKLVFEADRQTTVEAFVGDQEVLEPQVVEVPPVEHALAMALPPGGWGTPAAVAVLATRPSLAVVGMVVALVGESSSVAELGRQTGFAARVTLTDDISALAGSVGIAFVDVDGPDNYLATLEDPESRIEGRADRLLLLLAQVDSAGLVQIDADGRPIMELLSLYGRTAHEDADWVFECLRGRFSLSARSWLAAETVGWIFPSTNLVPWRHADVETAQFAAGTVTMRLRTYSAAAEDESATPPEVAVLMPAAYAQAPRVVWANPTGTGTTDSGGNITVQATLTDREGDLIAVRLDSQRSDGTAPVLHLDRGLPPTGQYVLMEAVTFPGDESEILTYTVRIEARDRAGNVTVSTRSVVRPQTGGSASNYPPPTFSPPGGNFAIDENDLEIEAGLGGLFVEYVFSPPGSFAPTEGSVSEGNSVTLSLNSTCRVWARTLGAGSPSAWVFADYQRVAG